MLPGRSRPVEDEGKGHSGRNAMFEMMDRTASAYENLTERLKAFRRGERTTRAGAGVILSVSVLLALAIPYAVLEMRIYLPPAAKVTLGGVLIIAVCAALGLFCLLPLLRRRTLVDVAREVERRFPAFEQRLIGALQLWPKRAGTPEGYAPSLIEGTILQAGEIAQDADFREALNRHWLRFCVRLLAGVVVAGTVLALLFPVPMRGALFRWSHPLTRFVRPPDTVVSVTPGDVEIVKGEDMTILLRVTGRIPDHVRIHTRELQARRWHDADVTLDADTLRYTFRAVKRSLEYLVSAGDGEAGPYNVTVIDRPIVRRIRAKYDYPPYTGLPGKIEEEGHLSAILGTNVTLDITANKSLQTAELLFERGDTLTGWVEDRAARMRLRIVQDDRYRIHLVDLDGVENDEPISYRILALEDEAPVVRVVYPGGDVDLSEDMKVALAIEARDDFGFSGVELFYILNDGQLFQRALPASLQDADLRISYLWDLSDMNLLPEDVIRYYVEVADNDAISGPKRSRSAEYRIRFPSLYEIFEDVERSQEEQIVTMEDMIEQGKEMKHRLDDLRRELMRRDIDWEQMKDVERTIESQKEMAKELEELSDRLGSTMDKLEQSGLSALETLRKMEQIRELMDELATPELERSMDRLHQALQELDRQEIQRAMEQFSLTQEEFQKRLDRTLSILKRLQAEQRMDSAIKRAEELASRQEEINRRVEETSSADTLARQEDALARDTDRLCQDLGKTAETMEEVSPAVSEEVSQLAERMAEQALADRMEEMAQRLRMEQRSDARRAGVRLAEDLRALESQLRAAREKLREDQKTAVSAEISAAMQDLLYLSNEEEWIADALQEEGSADLTERQAGLVSGASRVADRLLQTAQKTFFITPAIGKEMGASLQKMAQAASELEQGRASLGSARAREAMISLNRTTALLRAARSALNAAQSSTGLSEMLERLGAMAQSQMGVNQATEELFGKGELSMRDRAAMARLAAEQEALRQAAEDLARQMMGRSQVLGRLDQLGEEMKRIVRDLKRQRVDQRTLDRQKRILSRLLDAQRSMQRREYSRRRRSRPGGEETYRGPDALPESLGATDDTLRERMIEALRPRYPKQYRELIRRYFETLARDRERTW